MIAFMKYAVFSAAIGALALGAAAANAETAADASTASSTSSTAPAHPGARHWHRGGGMMVGALLHAAHELNLSAAQEQQIHTLLANARSAHKAAAQSGSVDLTVLANPGNAGYATAVQSIESRATQRIQSESELASSIYNVLTDAQKQQLPQVLTQMQAKLQARRAAWQQSHAPAASGVAN